MKLPSLDTVLNKAICSFKRFSPAIIAAIMGSLFCMLLVHLPYSLQNSHFYYWNIVMTCYLGMLLFISIEIFSERKSYSTKKKLFLFVCAIGLLSVYYWFLPDKFTEITFTRFILFALILHLSISIAPFIANEEINGFWQYNKTIFLRFLTSVLYTVVLFAGLSLALLAIDKLFNADINGDTYLDLWIFLTGIFNTWFFLSGFPTSFGQLELKKDYPKGLKIFTQYVLLPLITVYLVILYAYMFKIIVSAQWPIGWVSYLVLGFSIGGILSLLLIYPVRNDENNKWILIFSRFFYFALFPLIILLFLAVKRRISDYGITEQRYFILILALWLLFIAAYFLFSKSKNIKVIPISLCLLALASSFGPWGAFRVSLSNQKQHLKSLLEKHSMLSYGKIIAAKDTIPFKDHKQISSIINYLIDVHGYETLQPYFKQNLDSLFKEKNDNNNAYTQNAKIHSLINLNYISDYQFQEDEMNKYMNFYSNNTNNIIDIGGYDYLISGFDLNGYERQDTICESYLTGENKVTICFDLKKKQLLIFDGNKRDSSLIMDLIPLINSLEKEYTISTTIPGEKMTFILSNTTLNAKIIFKNISYQKENHLITQPGLTGDILIKKKKF